MMMKIAVIIPYFGKFPEYFDLYLYSCSKNPSVDFIFFTDCKLPCKLYNNTIFHSISFDNYCRIVSHKLNIQFKPSSPYKLCDLKPFYGIIHEDILSEYDWWGYGDIDLIYGDLTILLNENNLLKYDLITTHWNIVAGHFTIIRKASKYNSLCLRIPEYKTLLESDVNYILDETYFTKLVKSNIIRLFNSVLFHVFYFVHAERYLFYCYSKIGAALRVFHRSVLFEEVYSTFIPKPGVKCFYDLDKNEIFVPDCQLTKIESNKAKVYLHFLHYKKNKYRKSEVYWQDGFYKIPSGYDFEKNGGVVEISTDSIKLTDYECNS